MIGQLPAPERLKNERIGWREHEQCRGIGRGELDALHRCLAAFSLGRLAKWFDYQIQDKASWVSLGSK